MLKRPLFPVALAFAVGILISGVGHIPPAITAAVFGFGCACALARRRPDLALLFLVSIAGFLRYEYHASLPLDDISHFIKARPSATHGRVVSDVDMREDRALFTIVVQSVDLQGRIIPASGRLMVVLYKPTNASDWRPPEYGDLLSIHARPSQPSTASNPGAFSWRDYLARQRTHAVVYVHDHKDVRRLSHKVGNPLIVLALKAKQQLVNSIAQAMPENEAAVVTGMALGSYTSLPDRLMSNFTRTGTLHLLAASGFNCAVLVAVFGFILARIFKLRRSRVHLALILILIFYMMMIGAKPSIVRATFMASLLLSGVVFNRPSDPLNLLFAAVVIILAINPADLFDIGFQLSLAAVLALILVLPGIEEQIKPWRIDRVVYDKSAVPGSRAALFLVRNGWQGLTATIAATLGTLPLSAHYFSQFSLVSFIVNTVVAAAVLPIFVVGLLLPLLSPIPIIGDISAFIGTVITSFVISIINWFGELPYSCLSIASPGAVGVIGYYIILAAVISYTNAKIVSSKRTSDS